MLDKSSKASASFPLRTRLVFSGSLVLGAHIHNTVSINIEFDLNLWDTARRGWDTGLVDKPLLSKKLMKP